MSEIASPNVAPAPNAAPAAPGGVVAPAAPQAPPSLQDRAMAAEKPVANPADATTEQRERARIVLGDMDPTTEVVMKVDGKEVVMTAANAIRNLQRVEAAEQRFEAAKRLKREVAEAQQEIVQTIRDPARFRSELAALGFDPAQYIQALTQIEQQEQSLSPEARELRRLQAERQAFIAQQEQARQAEFARVQQASASEYSREFNRYMDTAGIPKSSELRSSILPILAAEVERAIEGNYKVTPSELMTIAKQRFDAMSGAVRQSFTRDQLAAMLAEMDGQQPQTPNPVSAQATPKPVIPGVQPSEQPRNPNGQYAEKPKSRFYRSGDPDALFGRR